MIYKLLRNFETNEIRTDMILGITNNEIQIYIPNNKDNKDWQKYQEWLTVGNEPEQPE